MKALPLHKQHLVETSILMGRRVAFDFVVPSSKSSQPTQAGDKKCLLGSVQVVTLSLSANKHQHILISHVQIQDRGFSLHLSNQGFVFCGILTLHKLFLSLLHLALLRKVLFFNPFIPYFTKVTDTWKFDFWLKK